MRLRRGVFILFVVYASQLDIARAQNELALDELLLSVRTHFPSILRSKADVDIASAQTQAALGAFDVVLGTDLRSRLQGYYENFSTDTGLEKRIPLANAKIKSGYRQSGGDFPAYEGDWITQTYGELYVSGTFSLLENSSFDPSRYKLFSSEQKEKIAALKFELQLLKTQETAAKHYWDWVLHSQASKIYESLLNLAVSRTGGLETRHKKGDLAGIFLVENKTYILQRQVDFAQSVQDYQNSAAALSLFFRDPSGNTIDASAYRGPMQFPSSESHVDLCVKNAFQVAQRPEWKQLDFEESILKAEQGWNRNKLWPNLDIKMEFNKNMGSGPDVVEPNEYKILGMFEIPIQNRFARGEVAKTRLEIDKIFFQKRLLKDEFHIRTQQLCKTLDMYKAVIQNIREEVQLNTELQDADTLRWRQGDGDFFLVNLREQTTAKSKLNLIRAEAGYHKLIAELYQVHAKYPIH